MKIDSAVGRLKQRLAYAACARLAMRRLQLEKLARAVRRADPR
jgi:hypothetical protein